MSKTLPSAKQNNQETIQPDNTQVEQPAVPEANIETQTQNQQEDFIGDFAQFQEEKENDLLVNADSERLQRLAGEIPAQQDATDLGRLQRLSGMPGETQPTIEPTPKETKPLGELTPTQQKHGLVADVVLGIQQAPRRVIRGGIKAINNAIDIGNKIDEYFNLPELQIFDKEGKLDIGIIPQEKAKELKGVEVPMPDKPLVTSVTGDMIEGISQFMFGFKGVDKALKASKGLSAAAQVVEKTKAGKVSADIVKATLGDLAAFDSQEKRLSNLVQQYPVLQNPVTEYLQASPEDSLAESKFKQALEGLGMGVITEGLAKGVGLLKKSREAKAQLGGGPEKLPEPTQITIREETKRIFGDASNPDLVIRTKQKLATAAKEVSDITPQQVKGAAKEAITNLEDVRINFARIQGPDDIKNIMNNLANDPTLSKSISAARRGVRGKEITLKAAEDISGFDQMMARRTGEAFNAEQIVAARKVYYDTTESLMEAARRAASPEATDVDQFMFRKMIATHQAVQKEFLGARAEAGRALQAWSIPLEGNDQNKVKMMESLINDFGGVETSKDLAKRLTEAGANLNTDQINTIVRKSALARTTDAVAEAWTLGLLTNPVTHSVNIASNFVSTAGLAGERFLQPTLFKNSDVTIKEAGVFFTSLIDAQKEAFANAAKAFKTGQSGYGVGKVDLPRVRATSPEILDAQGMFKSFGVAIDYWGRAVSQAGKALGAADEYFKTILYKAQVKALATREGIQQGLKDQQLKEYIAKTALDTPERISKAAADFANYGTFTKELSKSGQSVQAVINSYPVLRFVAPFIRTPVNIFKFTYERTPLALVSKTIREDIRAGGLRREAALTKMASGSMAMMVFADFASQGVITGQGPSDRAQRQQLAATGWKPYSIKIGDAYYPLNRLEPIGSFLGLSADITEILSNYESYDMQAQDEVDELVTAGIIALANQSVSKTYLTGFSELSEVLSDPGRYGERYIQRFFGSFVPAGVSAAERLISPEISEVQNIRDQIKSKIPGLSKQVPTKHNIWGEEIKTFYPDANFAKATGEKVIRAFTPFQWSNKKDAFVDEYMLKNGFSINMPSYIQDFDGIKINLREYPEIYQRLVVIRGQEAEIMGSNMQQYFQDLFQSDNVASVSFFSGLKNYDDQQNFIQNKVNDYTQRAKKQLLEEYPTIMEEVDKQRRTQEESNLGREPGFIKQKALP